MEVVRSVNAKFEPEEASTDPDDTSSPTRDRRADVVRAAVALFAEKGYKETTAAEIAQRAGISRRTFFYYFQSKDDVLFTVDGRHMETLSALVSEQPLELSDLEAVAAAWVSFGGVGLKTSGAPESRTRVTQLRRAAENSALLRGRAFELHLAYERALAHGLAKRRGLAEPDATASTAAAMGQSIMHLVVDRFVADPTTNREDLIAELFEAAILATLPPSGRKGSPLRDR